MSFWGGPKLLDEISKHNLIDDFKEHRIDCAAYTLRMGRQYYLSADQDALSSNKIEQLEAGSSLVIPPGQFAFLLTEERVHVPRNAIAFISMKSDLKFRGLVNVSGFHVDPGYDAPLKFAVFNAGPKPVCIKHLDDCFLIWYADLDDGSEEYSKSDAQNRNYTRGITGKDVSGILGAVTSVSVLAKKLDDLEKTQSWMKVTLFALGFIATIVIASVIYLSQEGLRSLLAHGAQ